MSEDTLKPLTYFYKVTIPCNANVQFEVVASTCDNSGIWTIEIRKNRNKKQSSLCRIFSYSPLPLFYFPAVGYVSPKERKKMILNLREMKREMTSCSINQNQYLRYANVRFNWAPICKLQTQSSNPFSAQPSVRSLFIQETFSKLHALISVLWEAVPFTSFPSHLWQLLMPTSKVVTRTVHHSTAHM